MGLEQGEYFGFSIPSIHRYGGIPDRFGGRAFYRSTYWYRCTTEVMLSCFAMDQTDSAIPIYHPVLL